FGAWPGLSASPPKGGASRNVTEADAVSAALAGAGGISLAGAVIDATGLAVTSAVLAGRGLSSTAFAGPAGGGKGWKVTGLGAGSEGVADASAATCGSRARGAWVAVLTGT